MHAQAEHTNSTQKDQSRAGIPTLNLCAVRQQCSNRYLYSQNMKKKNSTNFKPNLLSLFFTQKTLQPPDAVA